MKLADHDLIKFSEGELLSRGYRLGRRSVRLIAIGRPELQEGSELCIDNQWYEIFMADKPRKTYYLERKEPSGN